MINFLTGDRSLRRIRDRSKDFATDMYNPAVFNPQRAEASRMATQGIDVGSVRQNMLGQLNRVQPDTDIYGGNAARGMGMTQSMNANRMSAISGMEGQLGLADQQARTQGRQALAGIQSQQLQTGAMRDAAMSEADMMYEAERSSRRQALGGTALTLGTMGAMGMFPGIKGGALQLLNMLSGNAPGAEDGFEPSTAMPDMSALQSPALQAIRDRSGLNRQDDINAIFDRIDQPFERPAPVASTQPTAQATAQTTPLAEIAATATQIEAPEPDMVDPSIGFFDGQFSPESQMTREEYDQLRREFAMSQVRNPVDQSMLSWGRNISNVLDIPNRMAQPITMGILNAQQRREQAREQQFQEFVRRRNQ